MTSDIRPPTPMPCTTRTAMSMLVSVEKPAIDGADGEDDERELEEHLAVDAGRLSLPQIGRRDGGRQQARGDDPGVLATGSPPRSEMMTGIEVDTTVPESTATNMPTMRPERAMKTSRAERGASGAGDGAVVKGEGSEGRS